MPSQAAIYSRLNQQPHYMQEDLTKSSSSHSVLHAKQILSMVLSHPRMWIRRIKQLCVQSGVRTAPGRPTALLDIATPFLNGLIFHLAKDSVQLRLRVYSDDYL